MRAVRARHDVHMPGHNPTVLIYAPQVVAGLQYFAECGPASELKFAMVDQLFPSLINIGDVSRAPYGEDFVPVCVAATFI